MAKAVNLASADLIGQSVGGFEILCLVGAGGMGKVYKARQSGLDRLVALKILSPHVAQDQVFITRFQREARASARLNHPNVVQGIDAGWDEAASVWYFAMEYIEGPSLLAVIGDLGRLPERRALEIARDVARALECAHKHGMVHRDIKPDNILLAPGGEAKLADLGLAKKVADDSGTTAAHQALGTPRYMSPEQARGDDDAVDIRSDIYALGATLFHLVTGQTPFDGKTSAVVMLKHLTEPAPLAHETVPGISAGCGALIQKMLQKRREDRYETPAQVRAELERLIGTLTAAPSGAPNVREARPSSNSARAPGAQAARPGSSVRVATGSSRVRKASRVTAVATPAAPLPAGPGPGAVLVPRVRTLTMLEPARPSFWRGLWIDLAVLVVVGGLAAGAYYYLRSQGKLRWPSEKRPEPHAPEERPTQTPGVIFHG